MKRFIPIARGAYEQIGNSHSRLVHLWVKVTIHAPRIPGESSLPLIIRVERPLEGLFGVETSINSENTVKAISFFDFEVEKVTKLPTQAAEIEQLFYPPELIRVKQPTTEV